MAITFTGVTIIAPATGARRPCNGGAFNVQIRITGNCNAAGGRYAVDVYDEDVLPGGTTSWTRSPGFLSRRAISTSSRTSV